MKPSNQGSTLKIAKPMTAVKEELKPSVKKRLARLYKDVIARKNLSPHFSNSRDMDKWLAKFETKKPLE